MSEERVEKTHAQEEENYDSSEDQQESGVSRRDFVLKTVALASGLALSSLLPEFAAESEAAQATGCASAGQTFIPITEITSSTSTKTLQAVLKVLNEKKSYWAASLQSGQGPVCNSGQMRFFSGYNPTNPAQKWPTTSGVPTPGPTLRARVGDTVQITLLNQVDVSAFGNTIDVAEQGQGCDTATSVGPGGSGLNTYPGNPSFENPPNCFHGSSSTNLHFHGTHVSPSSIADNVLLNVRPSPIVNGKPVVNEQYVQADFDQIFKACVQGHSPQKWADLPPTWQQKQQQLLQEYDKTAPWKGGRGLPPEEQLWLQNEGAIASGQWPQYYVGGYASCLQLPIWNGQPTSMGQSPGTHWYHAHKHGSTALNLANGMAGAFIIEGPYDDALRPFYTKQLVMVLQQIGTQLNLLRNAALAPSLKSDLVFVNGQMTPVVQMKPNEMQFWRLINACHQRGINLDAPTGIKWVQTAQDGVQFNPKNYNPSLTNASFPIPANSQPPFGSLAPGNRIDLLVQAPNAPGTFQVTFAGRLLLTVQVTNDRSIPNPMPFPTPSQFPTMPGFLNDIDPGKVTVRRDLRFKSTPPRNRGTNPPYPPPVHTINDKQFSGKIDQTMTLGDTEEWTLYNESAGAAHPFHIHVNPFQVIEILNPAVSATPVKLPTPWVWWDNFAIPPAAVPPGGTQQVSGYVKILSRFVDFTGIYVLHCHILGHEDRGMMQLVQVVTDTTILKHH